MAPIRSGNLDRSRWRNSCREELSQHIRESLYQISPSALLIVLENRLGIKIEPSQVRLITRADDPYTWKVLPEKRHLFLKNISDHSIGAYKELCKGIGVAFEAVPINATTGTGLEDPVQEVLTSAMVCKTA